MSASFFRSPAKLPSLIIARWGQVWLPIGSPSGLARISAAPAARNPATAASVPVFFKNSRLESAATSVSFLSTRQGDGDGSAIGEEQLAELLVLVEAFFDPRPLPLRRPP